MCVQCHVSPLLSDWDKIIQELKDIKQTKDKDLYSILWDIFNKMNDLDEIYQELIIDHNRRPRNFGEPVKSTNRAKFNVK